jgi:hypothetical protein
MTETIYEMSKRMCNSANCADCPIRKVKDKACLISFIKEYEIEKVAEQLEVMYEWVKEHPTKTYKTYKDVFLERLPNARTGEAGRPLACRDVVFGIVKRCTKSCRECWNEPYKEGGHE